MAGSSRGIDGELKASSFGVLRLLRSAVPFEVRETFGFLLDEVT